MHKEELLQELEEKDSFHSLTTEEQDHLVMTLEKISDGELSLSDAMEITPELLDYAYGEACRYLQTGNYQEAKHLFSALHLFQPCAKYYIGLGTTYYLLQNYEMALSAYSMATATLPTRADLFFQIYDCFMHLENAIGQLGALTECINACGKDPKYTSLKSRAELCLETLEKALQEEKNVQQGGP